MLGIPEPAIPFLRTLVAILGRGWPFVIRAELGDGSKHGGITIVLLQSQSSAR